MANVRLIFFIPIFMLLHACSSQKGERILVMGDSNGAASNGWVDQLKKMRPDDTFCNLSIHGNTIGFDNLEQDTLNTLRNIDSYLKRAIQQMGGVDRILIWLGSNDCKAVFASMTSEILGNLNDLLREIKQNDISGTAKIVFIMPPPMAADSLLEAKYHGGEKRLKSLIPHLERVVKKNDCFFLNIHDSLSATFPQLNSDGIHLNKKGAEEAARIINQYLYKIVQ